MPGVDVALKPSRYFASLLCLIWFMTFIILFSLDILLWQRLVGIVLMSIYAAWVVWRYVLLLDVRSITRLKMQSDGSWCLYSSRKMYQAALRGDSTVTGFVSVLRFNTSKVKPLSVVIFHDALKQDAYRQLIVMLRVSGSSSV